MDEGDVVDQRLASLFGEPDTKLQDILEGVGGKTDQAATSSEISITLHNQEMLERAAEDAENDEDGAGSGDWDSFEDDHMFGDVLPATTVLHPGDYSIYPLHVNRVAKATRGGRRMSFSVILVAGNGKGAAGIGVGKALDIGGAQQKAIRAAMKDLRYFQRYDNRTVFHDTEGKFLRSKVLVMPRKRGFGIVANNKLWDVMKAIGITDVSVKAIGSRNPKNMVKACFNALLSTESPEDKARRMGKQALDVTQMHPKAVEHFKKSVGKSM